MCDSLGNTIHYMLDAAGGRIKEDVRDALGHLGRSMARAINSLGQVTAVLDASGRTNLLGNSWRAGTAAGGAYAGARESCDCN